MDYTTAWMLMDNEDKRFTFENSIYKSDRGTLAVKGGDGWEVSTRNTRALFLGDWQEVKEPVKINPCPACGAEMRSCTVGVGDGHKKDNYFVCINTECVVQSMRYCNLSALIDAWNTSTEKKEPEAIKTPSCIRCGCTCFMP